MGVAFSSLWSSLFGSKELKICILGYVLRPLGPFSPAILTLLARCTRSLDNAGKTTLMYKMTLGSVVSTAPTVGSNTGETTSSPLHL